MLSHSALGPSSAVTGVNLLPSICIRSWSESRLVCLFCSNERSGCDGSSVKQRICRCFLVVLGWPSGDQRESGNRWTIAMVSYSSLCCVPLLYGSSWPSCSGALLVSLWASECTWVTESLLVSVADACRRTKCEACNQVKTMACLLSVQSQPLLLPVPKSNL